MKDTFYPRLDFYRMLNSGMTNLAQMAVVLQVSVRTLQRWKAGYDPEKGPYGSLGDVSVPELLASNLNLLEGFDGQGFVAVNNDLNVRRGSREEIIHAVRLAALEGNVQAAKLLLSEYENQPMDQGDILTVERAVELMREWTTKSEQSPQNPN